MKYIQITEKHGLTPEVHLEIVIAAKRAGKTIGEYILDCVKNPLIFVCGDDHRRIKKEVVDLKEYKHAKICGSCEKDEKLCTCAEDLAPRKIVPYPKSKSLNKKK